MKIRHGFVSNSSSSSFIVAFPKRPKSKEDVLQYMFNGEKGNITQYEDSLSYDEIAEIVFKDIKGKTFYKRIIIEELTSRYYYSKYNNDFPYASCEYYGWEYDGWEYDRDRFFGSDKTTLEKLRKLCIKNIEEEEKAYKKCQVYIDSIVTPVSYAQHAGKESKEYTECCIKRTEIVNNDPIYKKLYKECCQIIFKAHELEMKLKEKLSKNDFEKFKNENGKCWIALLNYSDNDGGTSSLMEHAGIFRNLPHIRISHH